MKNNRVIEWPLIGVGVFFFRYVASVVWFEVQLGVNQPQGSTSIVTVTFNDDNERHEQIDGNFYIGSNHWPRSWYNKALDNPNLEVKMPGEDTFVTYTAVPLEGAEEDHIAEIYSFGFEFRFRTGFPPRYFMRLDEKT